MTMFHSARLRLTAWYLTIIMALSVMFSFAIYHVLTQEIQRFERASRFRIEHRIQNRNVVPLPISQELIEETRQRILLMLALVNAGILVFAGASGYILAGRTLAPIQTMVEEQRRFVSDASHELRTPLTSLKSAFEVFLRGDHPTIPEAQSLARESIAEVNKLQSLTESLLTLAQYSQTNGRSLRERVSLQDVAAQAIQHVLPLARAKHIRVKRDIRNASVTGNKDSLVQLLVILLDNAVKYSPQGRTVSVRVKKEDAAALVSVQDQGAGISTKDLPHIFDRFWRGDTARSTLPSGGFGLGLSIAKKIAQDHKGTLRVDSTPEKGSIFTVTLPAHRLSA